MTEVMHLWPQYYLKNDIHFYLSSGESVELM
ncbi:hypothetical protein VINE108274_06935 [Vibrio neptunius]